MPDLDSFLNFARAEYARLDAVAKAHDEASRDPQNPTPWNDSIQAHIYAECAVYVDEHIHRLQKEQA